MKRNIFFNALQVLFSTTIVFLTYRQLTELLGPEKFGFWSLTFAVLSGGKIIEMGLGTAVYKKVAECDVHDVNQKTDIFTGALLLQFIIFILLFLPLYFGIPGIINSAISQDYPTLKNVVNTVRDWSIMYLLTMSFATIFVGMMEGHRRMDLKLLTTLIPQIIILVLMVVKEEASIEYILFLYWIQALFTLCFGVVFNILLGAFKGKMGVPKISTLKDLLLLGSQIQLSGLFSLALDPFMKWSLTRGVGLSAVGVFEIAIQIIGKSRMIIISAHHATMGYLAGNKHENIDNLLIRIVKANNKYGIILFSILAVSIEKIVSIISPDIEVNLTNSLAVMLVVLAWSFNVTVSPWYFNNIAKNRVHYNIKSHVLMAIINVGGLIILDWLNIANIDMYFVVYASAVILGSISLIGRRMYLENFDIVSIFILIMTISHIFFNISIGSRVNLVIVPVISFLIIIQVRNEIKHLIKNVRN